MEREFTCIVCPIGCRLSVSGEDSGLAVRGNRCARGKAYALKELSAPERVVTALVRIEDGSVRGADDWAPKMLPVRTRGGFPKERIGALLEALRGMRIGLPVERGQVVLADALGTGVDVVASRSMPSA